MSHIRKAFLVFLSIYLEIHWKRLFWVWCFETFSRLLTKNFSIGSRKWYLRKKLRISQRLISSHKFEREDPEEYFDLMETNFLVKPVTGTNITKNCFPPQNEPNRAKLSSSGVLKHFCRNWLETSLLCQESNSSKRSLEILRKFYLNKFEKGKIQRNILIWWKQLFLVIPVNLDKYCPKLFSSSKCATFS